MTHVVIRILSLAALVALQLSACRRAAPAPAEKPPAAAPRPTGDADSALDRLDTRKPVPLLAMMAKHQKENMRDHLAAVQEIATALAADDFATVERAAARIGFSEPMGQMCTHMGAAAPGFTDQALHFHKTADAIGAAARAGDRGAVLHALGATLRTCTDCHATWKQQVVSDAKWQELTAAAPPSGHAAH